MGAGIYTKYARQVIAVFLAVIAIAAAACLYFRFRGPLGGVSPIETVNDLYGQEQISFTAERETYPADVETVQVTLRNDTEDTVVMQSPGCPNHWLLETSVDGVWHTLRLSPDCTARTVKWEFPAEEYGTVVMQSPGCPNHWLLETSVDGVWHTLRLSPDCTARTVKWEFPAEEYGPNSSPSGIVMWDGGEQRFLCNLAKYYGTPQEPGRYRIVFPEMEHVTTGALAVEFVVMWDGGEQRFLCNLAKYYGTPQEPGRYRIVFPEMEHVTTGALAVEFELR